MKTKSLLLFIFLSFLKINAQFSLEWTSSETSSWNVVGWISLNAEGNKYYYILDENKFSIMESEYSNTEIYSYNFTDEEILAGYQIYSLGKDLTSDGIYEFYILAYHGTADEYRQSFKIVNITNGLTVFERNDANFYYTYPSIWDVDADGIYECTFSKYDYPNYSSQTVEVYSTSVPTSVNEIEPTVLNFRLDQNFPNPFSKNNGTFPNTSNTTTINFYVPQTTNVNLEIYDITGKLVKNLINSDYPSGSHKVSWNGKNNSGREVASGTYFYRLTTNNNTITKKMVLIE